MKSRTKFLLCVVFPLLVLTSTAAHRFHDRPEARGRRPQGNDLGAVHDTLRLYYMGHAVGYERYDVVREAEGTRLSADFDYSERGRRTHIGATYRVARDYTPQLLEIARVTDGGSTMETRVEVRGRMASVLRRDTTRVALPAVAVDDDHGTSCRSERAGGAAIVAGQPSIEIRRSSDVQR